MSFRVRNAYILITDSFISLEGPPAALSREAVYSTGPMLCLPPSRPPSRPKQTPIPCSQLVEPIKTRHRLLYSGRVVDSAAQRGEVDRSAKSSDLQSWYLVRGVDHRPRKKSSFPNLSAALPRVAPRREMIDPAIGIGSVQDERCPQPEMTAWKAWTCGWLLR
jgi:hypothetical protein